MCLCNIVVQVIYVAPMKALAAEMVRNFGARLEPLGVKVRELTGDMQLTKAEIQRTQVSHSHLNDVWEEYLVHGPNFLMVKPCLC